MSTNEQWDEWEAPFVSLLCFASFARVRCHSARTTHSLSMSHPRFRIIVLDSSIPAQEVTRLEGDASHCTFDALHAAVLQQQQQSQPQAHQQHSPSCAPSPFHLDYTDEEGSAVSVRSQRDMSEALRWASEHAEQRTQLSQMQLADSSSSGGGGDSGLRQAATTIGVAMHRLADSCEFVFVPTPAVQLVMRIGDAQVRYTHANTSQQHYHSQQQPQISAHLLMYSVCPIADGQRPSCMGTAR